MDFVYIVFDSNRGNIYINESIRILQNYFKKIHGYTLLTKMGISSRKYFLVKFNTTIVNGWHFINLSGPFKNKITIYIKKHKEEPDIELVCLEFFSFKIVLIIHSAFFMPDN